MSLTWTNGVSPAIYHTAPWWVERPRRRCRRSIHINTPGIGKTSQKYLLESGQGQVHATATIRMSAEPKPKDFDGAATAASYRSVLVKYFTRKCGNVTEAEDLAQDSLERVLKYAHLESVEQAKAYIFRVAVNRWHDHSRGMWRRGALVEWDDAAAFAEHEETSPERVLTGEQELHGVVAALQELGERTRDVFMLDRLEHMKHAEIAVLYGISVSSVEKHVAKAVAHLARRAQAKS